MSYMKVQLTAYQLLVSADTKQAKFLEEKEEGVHHPHGPAKDDQNPDDICPQHMGGVPPEPPIVPGAPIWSCGTCNTRNRHV